MVEFLKKNGGLDLVLINEKIGGTRPEMNLLFLGGVFFFFNAKKGLHRGEDIFSGIVI